MEKSVGANRNPRIRSAATTASTAVVIANSTQPPPSPWCQTALTNVVLLREMIKYNATISLLMTFT